MRKLGYDSIFKQHAPDYKKEIDDIGSALVAVLSNGYPTNKSQLSKNYQLNNESSRKVTQLAIWYFSDGLTKEYLKSTGGYNLTEMEANALEFLISKGEETKSKSEQGGYSLDIYIYQRGGHDHMKDYQNLLGSTLIPKIPTSETEIQSNLIELNFEGIIENHSNTNSNLLEGSSQKHTLEETPRVPKIIMGQRGYTLPGKEGVSDTAIEFTKDTGGSEELLGSANAIETEDSKIPHIMGHGGKLAGEAGETQQAGQTGGHTPTIEITQDTQEGMSGSCASQTETEDSQKPTVIMGSQGQPIETSESTQGGMSGQSGNATETDDTKQPDVILGGQGQVINTEENLSGMSGQSVNITEIDDTKQPDVILGGQGQVIDISEHSSAGMSGSCDSLTTLEDAEHSTADSDTKQAGKERRLPQTSDQKHLPLSLLMPVILLLISLRAIFKYPFKDNN